MNIFDLIFIAVFFAMLVMLVASAVAALGGQRRRALGLLSGLGTFIATYLVVVVTTSLVSPERVLHLNEPQCFDDWCVSVDHVERAPEGASVAYTVTLRLFSRARGRAQRENGASVYVLDEEGRRYEPQEDSEEVPLNVLLGPGESVIAKRRFVVPAGAHAPGLVVAHGRFPGMFIIGDNESLFHKPSVVRFP
jgi:hypothetical protein